MARPISWGVKMVNLYAVTYAGKACAAICDEKEKAERLAAFLAALFPRAGAHVRPSDSFFPPWEKEGLPDVSKATKAFFDAEKAGQMLHFAVVQAFPEKAQAMAKDRNPEQWAALVKESRDPLIKGLRAIYAAQARAYWLCVSGQWFKINA